MDRLTSMSVFAKVAEVGSFSAAAEVFGLSAQMVGKHVRDLEQRLGARLINRTTRHQNLTEPGRAYYERCKLVLAEVDAAETLVADYAGHPRGLLRVSLPVLFGRLCAAPVLLRLARDNSELALRLSFSDRTVDLIEEDFDLAIRVGPVREQAGLMMRRIGGMQMWVVASPTYVAAHGEPMTFEDLERCVGIVYSRSGRGGRWAFPREDGALLEIAPSSRIRADDLQVVADAAGAGAGLAWLPDWLVRDRVASGELVRVLEACPSLSIDAFAVWLQAPRMPLRLRLALDALAAGMRSPQDAA